MRVSFSIVLFLAHVSSVVHASPLIDRMTPRVVLESRAKHVTCPAFTYKNFKSLAAYPPPYTVYTDAEPEKDYNPELKVRQDVPEPVNRTLTAVRGGFPRVLALDAEKIKNIALAAGHVLIIILEKTPELILATVAAGTTLVTGRPKSFQTDHMLPVSHPYAFIRSLALGSPMRTALEALLPTTGTLLTPLASSLRDILNSECNLMIVPGYINAVMGTLITTAGNPDPARFDAQAAEFISQYIFKIGGYYSQVADFVGTTMANAAAMPEVREAFIAFAEARMARAASFVTSNSVWTGPALITFEIGADGQPIGTCNGRCLVIGGKTITLPVIPISVAQPTATGGPWAVTDVPDPVTTPTLPTINSSMLSAIEAVPTLKIDPLGGKKRA